MRQPAVSRPRSLVGHRGGSILDSPFGGNGRADLELKGRLHQVADNSAVNPNEDQGSQEEEEVDPPHAGSEKMAGGTRAEGRRVIDISMKPRTGPASNTAADATLSEEAVMDAKRGRPSGATGRGVYRSTPKLQVAVAVVEDLSLIHI